MRSFDLILVFANFRRSSIFLPIIKTLNSQFSIGILPLELPALEKKKTWETDDLFLELCAELGAEVLKDSRYHAKIAIIPQWPFSDVQRKFLMSRLQADLNLWMIGLAMGNIHFESLGDIRIDKVLVIDLDLYHYRLSVRKEEDAYDIDPGSLVEIGLPFTKYPVLQDIGIDYLWANPTPFSLPDIIDRLEYLECVRSLISKIPADCLIVLKPHNGIENHDYIVNPVAVKLMKNKLLRFFVKKIYPHARERFMGVKRKGLKTVLLHLCNAYIYLDILKRVKPLRELIPYHNFSLELMLPHVKKGMITGRSNSIWHGLFVKLPVYNCVDKRRVKHLKNKMHYHSMKFFEVPFCDGSLEFDDRHFSIIREETRQKDLIKWLSEELVAGGLVKN